MGETGARRGGPIVVVMGVTGAGKSTIGHALAVKLGTPFVDGDDLHPATNIAKMTAGIPLDDDDRWPWLDRVGTSLADAEADGGGLVVACSALKLAYRDAIRRRAPRTIFVLLHASRDVLARNSAGRDGHFMPTSLLDSQLEILEPLTTGERGTIIDVDAPVAEVTEAAIRVVRSWGRGGEGNILNTVRDFER